MKCRQRKLREYIICDNLEDSACFNAVKDFLGEAYCDDGYLEADKLPASLKKDADKRVIILFSDSDFDYTIGVIKGYLVKELDPNDKSFFKFNVYDTKEEFESIYEIVE